ncbi:uncharacterized protein ciita isoform X2 [Centroberyx gerrardi]
MGEELTELVRSLEQREIPRTDEGNLREEEKWLEEVEETARRIALPLWQHWDRGQRVLLPLVDCMTPGHTTTDNRSTDNETQYPIIHMDKETEIAGAGRTPDSYAVNRATQNENHSLSEEEDDIIAISAVLMWDFNADHAATDSSTDDRADDNTSPLSSISIEDICARPEHDNRQFTDTGMTLDLNKNRTTNYSTDKTNTGIPMDAHTSTATDSSTDKKTDSICKSAEVDSIEITDPGLTLDTDGATDTSKAISVSGTSDGTRVASSAKDCTAADRNNNTEGLAGNLSICQVTDRSTDTAEDSYLPCLTADTQCSTDAGLTDDLALLLSPCMAKDALANPLDHTSYPHTHLCMIIDDIADSLDIVDRAADNTATSCSTDQTTDSHESKEEEEEGVDTDWGTKMQEVDLDPPPYPDYGEIPDLEVIEQYLEKMLLNQEAIFDFASWSCEEDLDDSGDVAVPTALPSPDRPEQRQKDRTPTRRKRPRVPRSERCTDENTPSRPKRQRGAGRAKSKEAKVEPAVTKGSDTGSELSPAGMVSLSTPPPRIIQLSPSIHPSIHPSIQFITLPDTPGSQFVQTLRLSPHPFIRLPLSNTAATPTYILVPAASSPCRNQMPPLSPVDGTVAPAVMGSSPSESQSDTASKALSPPSAPPLSPNMELSPCKESPLPRCQSPTVLDISQSVKDYFQQAKAHMRQTCQDMEAGLSLTPHYVDAQVVQRTIFRSRKNTNKCLDKELIIMGDAERQKNSLGRSQIFEGSAGAKPKRSVLLLGNAGMGKTTLIRKLCLDWASDCLPQFDFVFLLDGKALTLTEPTFSLQTLLLQLSPSAPSCPDPESVFAQVLAAPKRVLIIFDGFEDLRDYEVLLQIQEKDLASLPKDSKKQAHTVKQLYSAILQRILLPGCTFLISTRPRGAASQLLRRVDSLLEVCGFTSTDVETYVSQYFTDPALRASAMDCLKNSSYLLNLCWNPGLCRLVCSVVEQCKGSEVLPRTLTGVCRQALRLKMERECRSTHTCAEAQTHTHSQKETQRQRVGRTPTQRCRKNSQTNVRTQMRTRSRGQTTKVAEEQEKKEDEEEDGEVKAGEGEVDRVEERQLLSQLSSLAWEAVKGNSSLLPAGRTISARLRGVGLRTGLFHSHHLRRRQGVSAGEREGGGREDREEEERTRAGSGERKRNGERTGSEDDNFGDDHILSWANPFLQSYLAGVHLSLSRTVSDRTFLFQTLPLQSGPRGRRRPQREELELTQRFVVGLLFLNRTELRRDHVDTNTASRDTVVAKQAIVTKHLEGLCPGDLSPAQLLEVCHYLYEASVAHSDGGARLAGHLAQNLPEVLTFRGVPLSPPDVFVVRKVLERGGTEGRRFCLGLEDTGIRIAGLRALVGLCNINTFRACIADVINLWEELQQSGEEELLKGAVSKLKINPLKATQVCHIEHLAKLVNIHTHRRLSDSSSQSDSILAEGVPAVRELHKLELELGPENGPLALPKLWELLPGLQNLQHLDLENSKIGDRGAEELANALVSLPSLQILNLSQNCIGDQGLEKLAPALKTLPSLHCLSIYSSLICDGGAESLAAVLPHMASLTDLDVTYNKLTDAGAQSLGASLKNCPWMKSLRMCNEYIPPGVFDRLQQQDHRILS